MKAPSETKPRERSYPQAIMLGLLGGAIGSVIGHLVFAGLVGWMALKALAIPGVLAGMGFGWLSGRRSWLLGALSAVLAAFTANGDSFPSSGMAASSTSCGT